MTGHDPFGFGPGSPIPYTGKPGQTQLPNQTMDYAANDWRSNQYARGHADRYVRQAEPYTVCPQQMPYGKNRFVCAGTTIAGTAAGSIGGAYAAGAAAAPICAGTTIAAPLCIAGAAAAGSVVGAGVGFFQAQGSNSCSFIMNGAGQCIDASYYHQR